MGGGGSQFYSLARRRNKIDSPLGQVPSSPSKMSNCYHATDSVYDWMMVVTLEHLEHSGSVDAKDFFDRFKHTEEGEHCGSWIGYKGSTFTQADKWAPLWWEFLEGCLDDLPKTLVAAMKNECIHRWTRIMLEDDVEFVRAIKNMATDYDMNPDDEDAHLEAAK